MVSFLASLEIKIYLTQELYWCTGPDIRYIIELVRSIFSSPEVSRHALEPSLSRPPPSRSTSGSQAVNWPLVSSVTQVKYLRRCSSPLDGKIGTFLLPQSDIVLVGDNEMTTANETSGRGTKDGVRDFFLSLVVLWRLWRFFNAPVYVSEYLICYRMSLGKCEKARLYWLRCIF